MSSRYIEIEFDTSTGRKAPELPKVSGFNQTSGIGIDVESIVFREEVKQRARERKIDFGEAAKELRAEACTAAALKSAQSGRLGISPTSILYMQAATARAAADGIEYGSALKLIYAESPYPPLYKFVVASVEGGVIVLNGGSDVGVKPGDRFVVQRPNTAVTDPASGGKSGAGGRIIRQLSTRIGELRVTEADRLSALATGIPAADLKIGDICEPV